MNQKIIHAFGGAFFTIIFPMRLQNEKGKKRFSILRMKACERSVLRYVHLVQEERSRPHLMHLGWLLYASGLHFLKLF